MGQLLDRDHVQALVVDLEQAPIGPVQPLLGPSAPVARDARVQHQVVVARAGHLERVELEHAPGARRRSARSPAARAGRATGRACGGRRGSVARRQSRARSLDWAQRAELYPFPILGRQMATQRDYYDILGVPRGAPDEDIKRSFRKLAQQWHPDVNTSAEADARFKEINEAYQVLSDPQRRQAYDMFGHAAGAAARAASTRSVASTRARRAASRASATSSTRSLAAPPAGATPAARADRRGPALRPRADLRRVDQRRREGDRVHRAVAAARRATAAGAEPGTEPTTCPKCQGTGELRQRPLDDARPDRQRRAVRSLQGHGQDRRDAVPHVPGRRPRRAQAQAARDHPGGHRRQPPDPPVGRGRGRATGRGAGQPVRRRPCHAPSRSCAGATRELYYDLSLSITQAALGRAGDGPDGRRGSEEIEIKAGTQTGSEIRLRGKGVPHLRRQGSRGDLHVMVDVHVPQRVCRPASASCSRSCRSSWATLSPRTATRLAPMAPAAPSRRAGRAPARQEARSERPAARRDQLKDAGIDTRTRACPRPGRGSSCRSAPTRRRSSRSARSCRACVPAAWRSRHPSSCSTKDLPRGSIRAGRPSSAATSRPTTRPPRAPRLTQARADLAHLQAFELRPIGEVETRVVHEEDWAEAWKEHFPVLRVGRRLVIRPTWREHDAAPDDVVISLDPGQAFGTGPAPHDAAVPGGHRGRC